MVNCHAEFSGYKTSGSNVFFSKHSFLWLPSHLLTMGKGKCKVLPPLLFSLDARHSVVKVYPHLGGHSPLVGCALSSGGYLGLGVLACVVFCLFLLNYTN